jgi:organic hydroperoxide reductase OsmC/OhrA
MPRTHQYDVHVAWTGNRGTGTSAYRAYSRDHVVTTEGRPALLGSSEPTFRGDPTRWNPELLLVASLAQCHMLWYLHLASTAGIVVVDYVDTAHGVMALDADGFGRFESVTLRPTVTITTPERTELAGRLHEDAAARCFIARSVNFPVHHEPVIRLSEGARTR